MVVILVKYNGLESKLLKSAKYCYFQNRQNQLPAGGEKTTDGNGNLVLTKMWAYQQPDTPLYLLGDKESILAAFRRQASGSSEANGPSS